MGKRARFSTVVSPDEFAVLESPHPYGVLPAGNMLLDNACNSSNSLNTLASDETWLTILSFCDAQTLGRLVQTCHYFYVAGHQVELWRDLVLQKSSLLETAGPTWKDAYLRAYHNVVKPHVPMAVSGVYSDYFFRLHSCRSFSTPASWTTDCCSNTIDCISVHDMTTRVFVDKYERPNVPVLVQEAAKTWPAYENWHDVSYLQKYTTTTSITATTADDDDDNNDSNASEKQSVQTFRATSGVAPLPAQFTMQAYLEYVNALSYESSSTASSSSSIVASTTLEEGPLYLFDRAALAPDSPLWRDCLPALYKSCPYWDPCIDSADKDDPYHDLLQVLGEGRRPDHTWLIMGPKRSGSIFHVDPNHTHAWNATIVGRKRWIFYPPTIIPPGVYPSSDGDQVVLPLSIGEWLLQYWGEHCKMMCKNYGNNCAYRPMECTSMPGDVVFVPQGWWHMVINLDEPVNIAVTHNYVSASNLADVLDFFEKKQDQISGCRDRAESIKPDSLLQEFMTALRNLYPDLLSTALSKKSNTTVSTCETQCSDSDDSNDSNSKVDRLDATAAAAATKGKDTQHHHHHQQHHQQQQQHVDKKLKVMIDEAKSGGSTFSFSFM